MKKQNKLILGFSALAVAGVGAFLLLRKKPTKGSSPSPTPTPITTGEFGRYKVATLTGNLNVRNTPSMSGSVVASLPKGSIVLARESSANGWYEYSKDGVNVTGYVSKLFLSSNLGSSTSGGAATSYSKYKVVTSSGNLNVRSTPSSTASIVASLPKDSIVWAKPSGTSGWLEYSADGNNKTGYVSETYLQLI